MGQTLSVLKSAIDYLGLSPRKMRKVERQWCDAERHQRPLRMKSTARRRWLRRIQFQFIGNQYAYMHATKYDREYLFSSMGVPPDVYAGVRS